MDIFKYKLYVKDVSLTDEEFQQLFMDVYKNVCKKTRIFKQVLGFNISSCEEYYDFRAIYEILDATNDNVVTSMDVYNNVNENNCKDYLDSFNNGDCSKDISDYIGIKVETDNLRNEFVSFDDAIVYKEGKTPYSALDYYLEHLYRQTYKYNWRWLERDGYSKEPKERWEIPLLLIYSVVPNTELVDEDMEDIIKDALITGIQYYANTLFMNQSEQITQLAQRRYMYALNDVINSMPQIESMQLRGSINRMLV
jgi:hypothetical protein